MIFDIVKNSELENTFKVAAVCGKFDITNQKIEERFVGEIPIEDKIWNIGLIYGNSGTGKSTIARELFKVTDEFEYTKRSVIDDLPGTVDEITQILNSVGFSSPPSWLKPYSVLSNGEKMRVNLARAILENSSPIVFDEFTSVVDRTVAKIGSVALAKAVRKQNKKFIAVTCHEDVKEWLAPDWTYNTNTGSFFLNQEQDQKLKSKLENPVRELGLSLGSIII